MEIVITITLPFFALIGCGYLAGKKKVLGEEGAKGLGAFVYYFALPGLIFSSLAGRPIGDIVNPAFMGAYLAAGIAVFAAAFLGGRLLFGGSLGMDSIRGQSASVGNVGFLALPLITALLGKDAALPVVLGWLVDMIVLVPLSLALLEANRHTRAAIKDFITTVLRAVAINPLVIAIAAGVLYAASGYAVPAPLASFAGLLGQAAGPTALFALGVTLAGRPVAEGLPETAYIVTFKLIVHPAAMWLSMVAVFGVDPLWAAAAILTAAAPIAANVYIIAQRFDVYVMRASSAILVSTALSILTFSVLGVYLID